MLVYFDLSSKFSVRFFSHFDNGDIDIIASTYLSHSYELLKKSF